MKILEKMNDFYDWLRKTTHYSQKEIIICTAAALLLMVGAIITAPLVSFLGLIKIALFSTAFSFGGYGLYKSSNSSIDALIDKGEDKLNDVLEKSDKDFILDPEQEALDSADAELDILDDDDLPLNYAKDLENADLPGNPEISAKELADLKADRAQTKFTSYSEPNVFFRLTKGNLGTGEKEVEYTIDPVKEPTKQNCAQIGGYNLRKRKA